MITPLDILYQAHKATHKPFKLEFDTNSRLGKGGFKFFYSSQDRNTFGYEFKGRKIRMEIYGKYVHKSFPFKNYIECEIRMDVFPSLS